VGIKTTEEQKAFELVHKQPKSLELVENVIKLPKKQKYLKL